MHHFILPGWQNSGPAHWQSLWEAQHGYSRVMQHDWMHPLRGDWITRLEDHLLSIHEHSAQQPQGLEAKKTLNTTTQSNPGYNLSANASVKTQAAASQPDTLLIAHSLGCHLVAAWAALSKNTHRIRGALLVAPPDAQREDFPLEMKSWRQPVLHQLPFPSICVISSNDPFCGLAAGRQMAQAWGSECVELGDKGHINAGSGLGDWPQGRAMLERLAAQA
jgi:uncharacterized protein